MSQPSALDPGRDGRRLAIYFGVLATVYALGLWINSAVSFDVAVTVLMFAPFFGALAARYAGPGVIQWGRPNWWLLAAFIPALAGLAVMLMLTGLGAVSMDGALLRVALFGAVGGILSAVIGAFGEEVGWRGFLWPLFRRRMAFLTASAIMAAIWLTYHVPLVLLGDYGSLAGLPAFITALVGFTLFVGVLTDRSRSLWPSVLSHGVWNALVATDFDGAFTGDQALMGEFGWIPAATMLAIGVAATAWHQRNGGSAPTPS